ncbi:MAG TPA: type VI secretion system contractile sheath small subunit [Candidatus Sulfotelmatobacter sp.]|nr:type VI secretion system contractile sheath small subunit [Candidatus Sulfotelmatobacter sp.]
MAGKEGSAPPMERINIVYRSLRNGVQEEIELPLKLMVLGDFTQREDDTPLEERKAIQLDKDNFNDVMAQQKLNASFNVSNKLSGAAGEEMPVDINIGNMKDFSPAEVARQVPELRKLLELREALVGLKSPLGNSVAFRKKLDELLKDPAQREKLLKELGAGE